MIFFGFFVEFCTIFVNKRILGKRLENMILADIFCQI
jgi:hypothetical protein